MLGLRVQVACACLIHSLDLHSAMDDLLMLCIYKADLRHSSAVMPCKLVRLTSYCHTTDHCLQCPPGELLLHSHEL